MKRIGFLFGIALLTFTMGYVVTWGYYRIFLTSFVVEEVRSPLAQDSLQTSSSSLKDHQLSGQLQIDSQKLVKIQDAPYLEFDLTNGSSEIAYYIGYTKSDLCLVKIKRGSRVEQLSVLCSCGTGLREQSLLPGESATFQIPAGLLSAWRLPPATKTGKVGFEFFIGHSRHSQTLWSDKIDLSESLYR
jgi:hypothetical protein